MNTKQFIKLTEAYGANVKRWPAFYQPQAAKLISLNSSEIHQALEQEGLLDEIFSSHVIAPAERTLFESIISSAPQKKKSFWQQLYIKNWIGISSFIGTGLAGALAGAFFVSIWTSGMLPENIGGVSEISGSIAQYVDIGQEWS